MQEALPGRQRPGRVMALRSARRGAQPVLASVREEDDRAGASCAARDGGRAAVKGDMKMKRLQLRMPANMHDEVSSLAKSEMRSLNGEIVFLVSQGLKSLRKQGAESEL